MTVSDVLDAEERASGPFRSAAVAIFALLSMTACSSGTASQSASTSRRVPVPSAEPALTTAAQACPVEVLAAANVVVTAAHSAANPQLANAAGGAALDRLIRSDLIVSAIAKTLGYTVVAGRPLQSGDLASEAAHQCALQDNPALPLDEVQELANDPTSNQRSRLLRITYSG